jgi:hypothetical protein
MLQVEELLPVSTPTWLSALGSGDLPLGVWTSSTIKWPDVDVLTARLIRRVHSHLPSGEIWPWLSTNGVTSNGTGFRSADALDGFGSSQMSAAVFALLSV